MRVSHDQSRSRDILKMRASHFHASSLSQIRIRSNTSAQPGIISSQQHVTVGKEELSRLQRRLEGTRRHVGNGDLAGNLYDTKSLLVGIVFRMDHGTNDDLASQRVYATVHVLLDIPWRLLCII
jgi:hypothetical protein